MEQIASIGEHVFTTIQYSQMKWNKQVGSPYEKVDSKNPALWTKQQVQVVDARCLTLRPFVAVGQCRSHLSSVTARAVLFLVKTYYCGYKKKEQKRGKKQECPSSVVDYSRLRVNIVHTHAHRPGDSSSSSNNNTHSLTLKYSTSLLKPFKRPQDHVATSTCPNTQTREDIRPQSDPQPLAYSTPFAMKSEMYDESSTPDENTKQQTNGWRSYQKHCVSVCVYIYIYLHTCTLTNLHDKVIKFGIIPQHCIQVNSSQGSPRSLWRILSKRSERLYVGNGYWRSTHDEKTLEYDYIGM